MPSEPSDLCFNHPRNGVLATRQHHRLDPRDGQPVGKKLAKWLKTGRTPYVLYIAEGPGPGRYEAPRDNAINGYEGKKPVPVSSAPVDEETRREEEGGKRAGTRTRTATRETTASHASDESDSDMETYFDESSDDEEEATTATESLKFGLGRDHAWTREELQALWLKYDNNNSGQISLAEIKTAVEESFPEFNDDAVLMRAYHFADEDNSGLITKNEFTLLLRALPYFQHLWLKFNEMDTDGDGSLDVYEFVANKEMLGLEKLTKKQARRLFLKIDNDSSGKIRFFELCAHLARQKAGAEERRDERKAKQQAVLAEARRVVPWRQRDMQRRFGCGSSKDRSNKVLDAPIPVAGRM